MQYQMFWIIVWGAFKTRTQCVWLGKACLHHPEKKMKRFITAGTASGGWHEMRWEAGTVSFYISQRHTHTHRRWMALVGNRITAAPVPCTACKQQRCHTRPQSPYLQRGPPLAFPSLPFFTTSVQTGLTEGQWSSEGKHSRIEQVAVSQESCSISEYTHDQHAAVSGFMLTLPAL